MKISKLQVIIITISVIAAVVAVLIFSGVLPGYSGSGSKPKTSLTMWGTLSESAIQNTLITLRGNDYNIEIAYQQKNPTTFESEFVDALARGAGPDLVIFPSEMILPEKNKLVAIPYETIGERLFRDTFADGTESLLTADGAVGLPLLIDPMVLFYNKDSFRNQSIAGAPRTWDEYLSTSQALTKLDAKGNISLAGSAMGTETNVGHFKEIMSLLVLQTGSTIIDPKTLKVDFADMDRALVFYTQFSDPQKLAYSWGKSMPESGDAFARESLAMYFGFGSEFRNIQEQNPHLNFDIATVPQILGGKLSLTYGKFFSIGITRQTKKYEGALRAIQAIAEKSQLKNISQGAFMAPARRDLLLAGTKDPVMQAIFTQAVKFRTWLDINYARTSEIFANMIKSVYTGAKPGNQATRDAKEQFDALYNQ